MGDIWPFLVALSLAFSVALQAKAEGPVLWQRTYHVHDRANDHPRTLLPALEGGFRIAGFTGWRPDQNDPKSWKEEWWLLRLDESGELIRTNEFVTVPNEASVSAAIGHGRSVFAVGHMLGWIAEVDADGVLAFSNKLSPGEELSPQGIIARGEDRFAIAGGITRWIDRKPHSDAWLGEVDLQGHVLWEKSIDRGSDETAYALLATADGGFVLAINSGLYNKFGQGPSAIYVIRCDAKGNRVADASIENGRINPSGQRYLAPCGDGFAVSYTKSQLPPLDHPLAGGPSWPS